MTIRDNKEYIRVLAYSYHTPIAGWYRVGGPPNVHGLRCMPVVKLVRKKLLFRIWLCLGIGRALFSGLSCARADVQSDPRRCVFSVQAMSVVVPTP